MKLFFILALFVPLSLLAAGDNWETNFPAAQARAQREHKYILLSFSGSDWCGPCIRMRQELFESEVFKNYASANLVLVNADFPRQKKNQLPKQQQQQNEGLADKYNPGGNFPYTVLLSPDGKPVKQWDGFPKEKPEEFVHDISAVIHD